MKSILVRNALFTEQEVLSGPSSFTSEKSNYYTIYTQCPAKVPNESYIEVIVPGNFSHPSNHFITKIRKGAVHKYILLKG